MSSVKISRHELQTYYFGVAPHHVGLTQSDISAGFSIGDIIWYKLWITTCGGYTVGMYQHPKGSIFIAPVIIWIPFYRVANVDRPFHIVQYVPRFAFHSARSRTIMLIIVPYLIFGQKEIG